VKVSEDLSLYGSHKSDTLISPFGLFFQQQEQVPFEKQQQWQQVIEKDWARIGLGFV